MSRARQGHTPLLSFRETAAMKPLPSFPLITCVLCRDLLYMSKGLRDCFFHPVFWRTASLVRQQKKLESTALSHMYFSHMS